MSNDLNRVFLTEHCTNVPQTYVSKSGTKWGRMNVAFSFTSSKGKTSTNYFDLTFFGDNAEKVEQWQLSPSERLLIIGSLTSGSFKNKAGQTVYTKGVNIQQIALIQDGDVTSETLNLFPTIEVLEENINSVCERQDEELFGDSEPMEVSEDDLANFF